MKRALTQRDDALGGVPILGLYVEGWWKQLQDPRNTDFNIAQFHDLSVACTNRFALIDRMGTIFTVAYVKSREGDFDKDREISDHIAHSDRRIEAYRKMFSDWTDKAPAYKIMLEEMLRQRKEKETSPTAWKLPTGVDVKTFAANGVAHHPAVVGPAALSPGDCRQEWRFEYVPGSGRWKMLGFDSGGINRLEGAKSEWSRNPGQVASRKGAANGDIHQVFKSDSVPTD